MQYQFTERQEFIKSIEFANSSPIPNVTNITYFKEEGISGEFIKKEFSYSWDNATWTNWNTLTQGNLAAIQFRDNSNFYLKVKYTRTGIGTGNILRWYLFYEGSPVYPYVSPIPAVNADTLNGEPGSYYLNPTNFIGPYPGITVLNIPDSSAIGVYSHRVDTSFGTELFFKCIEGTSNVIVTENSGIITLDTSIFALTDASGTLSQTFQLYMTNNGVKLKDVSGNLEIRNYLDNSYTGIRASSLNIGTASSLYLLNIKEEIIESLLNSYYVIDSSNGFQGVYSTPPISGLTTINDASAYSNITGDKCLYKVGNDWFLQAINSSSLIANQTQSWNGPFWYNTGSIVGTYFGNSNYYGHNLTILNYTDTYKKAVGIQGNIDILGYLGVHGKIIAEALKLDPSYNGVLIAINGEVGVSAYPKTKNYDTSINGNGIDAMFQINHDLSTLKYLIGVYDTITQEEIFPDKIRGNNTSILNFITPPILGQSYDVIVLGY